MVRTESPRERAVFHWSALVLVLGTAFSLWDVWRVSGLEGLATLGSAAVTSVLLLGKFVIFLGLHRDTNLSPATLALMVWLIDLLLAYALASGLGGLERIPLVGRGLRRARARALQVLREYPGLERMAFLGVVAFVMLPLAATGAITGSFVARIVELRRVQGILAIAIGSAGTALTFLLLARFLGERAEELVRSPLLIGGTILVLAIVGRAAWVHVTTQLRRG